MDKSLLSFLLESEDYIKKNSLPAKQRRGQIPHNPIGCILRSSQRQDRGREAGDVWRQNLPMDDVHCHHRHRARGPGHHVVPETAGDIQEEAVLG